MAREEEGHPVLKGAFCHPLILEQSAKRTRGRMVVQHGFPELAPPELNRLLDGEIEGRRPEGHERDASMVPW